MFDTLSLTQHEIVFNKTGKFVVRACPGSGKTYCVSARLARMIKNWKSEFTGIAALSFTNVAWQEIDKKLTEEFKSKSGIVFPHFLGTIDSFINKYIFLPYGHLVMKCNCRPTLVGEPHGSWAGSDFGSSLFDNISYTIDGSMYAISPTRMKADWKENKYIVGAKKRYNKAGYATQPDANYYAMKVLENYPAIAKALSLRFPVFIVDEAQDTSDIQMRIIDLLIAQGLNEVMLVGDPDQAIFEWNDAKPELLTQKFDAWQGSIVLNENRRSSQKICNFTHKISSLPVASNSVDPTVKEFPFQPVVRNHNNNLTEIVTVFLETCTQNGIEHTKENIAVVFRAKDLIYTITGLPDDSYKTYPWVTNDNLTRDFAMGKFLYDSGNFKKGFKLIEKAVLKLITTSEYCSEQMISDSINKLGFTRHRSLVFEFIKMLPVTNVSLGQWIDKANTAFNDKGVQPCLKITGKSIGLSFKEIFVHEEIATTNLNYRVGTVHSVKGETFDATLLILKERASNRGKYSNILSNANPPSEHEELRIAYVGMTRPRKVLMIAVPTDECKVAWEKKLNDNN